MSFLDFGSPCRIKLWRALYIIQTASQSSKVSKELNHSIVLFSYESTAEAQFSHDDADIICNSGNFYIRARADSRTRRRPVSRSVDALAFAFCQAYVAACGTNGNVPMRYDASYQRKFLFARGEVPSTEPLLLPAREIRYEVYPCIFEDRCRCPTLGRTCCADQNSLDLFTVVRSRTISLPLRKFWSVCNI